MGEELGGIKACDHIDIFFENEPVTHLPILLGGGDKGGVNRPARQPLGAVGVVIDIQNNMIGGGGEGFPKVRLYHRILRTQNAVGHFLRPHVLLIQIDRRRSKILNGGLCRQDRRGHRRRVSAACGGLVGLAVQYLLQFEDVEIIVVVLLFKGGDLTFQQIDLGKVAAEHQLRLRVVVLHQHIALAHVIALLDGDFVKAALGHIDLLHRARRHIAVQRLGIAPVGGVYVHHRHYRHLFGGLAACEKDDHTHHSRDNEDNDGDFYEFLPLHRPPPPSRSSPSRM